METDQRYHQKNNFPLLVVEGNKDHQLVIGYCLRAKIPQAEPMFAATAKEASSFLELAFAHKKTFPRLVILDPLLPTLAQGIALLNKIRTTYPLLPIVILSAPQEQHLVNELYQLGAHSVIVKPRGLEVWEEHFQALKEYWLDVVTLPKEL